MDRAGVVTAPERAADQQAKAREHGGMLPRSHKPPGAHERGMLPRSDELLARLVASGRESAFRALYQRYQPQIYRYCYSIVRSEADAQDALQAAFTSALVALREGRRTTPLRPWLYRIAHNESVSVLRARRSVLPESECEAVALGPSAEQRAEERARLATLLDDLERLPERSRAALIMRELGGLSHQEIAAALQISAGAAKQAIFEARSALLELADGRAMACDEVMRRLSDGDRRVLRGRQVRAHLRECARCSAFAATMPSRQAELRVLCPTLAPAAAAAVLTRVWEGAAAHAGRAAVGASAASSGSTVAGPGGASVGAGSSAASAAKLLAAVVTPKALLATAVTAGVAAGAGGLVTASPAQHPAGVARHDGARALRSGSARGGAGTGAGDSAGGAGPTRTGQSRRGNTATRGHRAPGRKHTQGHPGPGHGANAPGHNTTAPGNSGNAPGHSGNPPGHSGNAPGHSGNAPGHSGNPPGHTHSPPGHTRIPPGHARHHHSPPGQSKPHGNPHGH